MQTWHMKNFLIFVRHVQKSRSVCEMLEGYELKYLAECYSALYPGEVYSQHNISAIVFCNIPEKAPFHPACAAPIM